LLERIFKMKINVDESKIETIKHSSSHAGTISQKVGSIASSSKRHNPHSPVCSGKEIFETEFEEVEPIVEGLQGAGEDLLVFGPTNIGKSLFTLLYALIIGCPNASTLWGRFKIPRPRKTLFLQSENTMYSIHMRLQKIVQGNPDYQNALNNIRFPRRKRDCRISGDLANREFLAEIRSLIQFTDADLIVIDPLISFIGCNENDNSEMRRTLDSLKEITTELKIACLMVHHVGKGSQGSSRGASSIEDWADNVLMLEEKLQDGRHILSVTQKLARNMQRFANPLLLERLPSLELVPLPSKEATSFDPVCQVLLEHGGTFDCQKAYVEALIPEIKCSEKTARKMIHEAVEKGLVSQENGEGRRKRFFIPSEETEI
jgi:archaellum biogenesis ATPase FlaH